jgi:molybdopterin-containing oxidoreductase family iron-sulfur binding subunit
MDRKLTQYFQSPAELAPDAAEDQALATLREREIGLPPSHAEEVERRDFMKLLGATFAAAGVIPVAATTSGCERLPKTTAMPYVDKPEGIFPGKAVYYATTCRGCAAGCGLLVKSRDGRPIKIEGNPQHPVSQGGVCAIGQGMVIDLYDGDRLRAPKMGGKAASWKDAQAEADKALAGLKADAKAFWLVTPPITGAATTALVAEFLAAFPGARHVQLDDHGGSAIRGAHGLTHGRSALPRYHFESAEHVVSLDADLLGTWIDPVAFTKGWSKTRKVGHTRKEMSTLAVAETRLSLTGSNADDRLRVLPSEMRTLALGLLQRVAAQKGFPMPVSAPDTKHGAWLDTQAKALLAHEGRGLVVAGSDDVAIQTAVNAVNDLCGNYGTTVDLNTPLQLEGDTAAETALLEELAAAKVQGIVLWDVNPCHAGAAAKAWREGLAKVPFSALLTTRDDETAAACKVALPIHHPLEAWGDCEVQAGLAQVQQPLVNPLHDTRQAEDVLLGWLGKNDGFLPYMQGAWKAYVHPRATGAAVAFQTFWDQSVHDGFVRLRRERVKVAVKAGGPAEDAAPQPLAGELTAAALAGDASAAALAGEATAVGLAGGATTEGATAVDLAAGATPIEAPVELVPPPPWRFDAAGVAKGLASAAPRAGGGGKFELALYQKIGIGDGRHANNPFLQELPDPISKATWGNYVCLSPKTGAELGLADSDLATVAAGGVTVTLPVVLSPGLHDGAVALAVGYGRKGAGRLAAGHGADAWPFAALGGLVKVEVSKQGGHEPVAFAQTHHSYEHRDIVKETTLHDWQQDPAAGNPKLDSAMHDPAHPDKRFTRTMWSRHQYPGIKWGMAIDLNSCTGCGACIIACNVENNVPVVGKREVLVRRDMHWLRIDRYFSERKKLQRGEYDWQATKPDLLDLADNPETVHMPMLCQHCDNAGCETVCPVLATVHTSEGLNAQVYNRCVGTRYCANNCAYKVRRFNWFNYPTREMADKFDLDLVTLALNPDVVKRSRGVMEKCSFCVQRIQETKSDVIREGRALRDGDVVTACQQTCPADAIVFGNINEAGSAVRKAYEDPRNYSALVEVGTQPAVTYMTKVRNQGALGNYEPAPIEHKAATHGEHHG